MLIVIDLTIKSYVYGEFEFTVKTMNAILSERFTDHQRVNATYTLSYIGLGVGGIDGFHRCEPASSHIGSGICHRWQISQ